MLVLAFHFDLLGGTYTPAKCKITTLLELLSYKRDSTYNCLMRVLQSCLETSRIGKAIVRLPASKRLPLGRTRTKLAAMPGLSEGTESQTHVERAWQHYNRLGAPKFHVAPMVDQVRETAKQQHL
jgi:hypothetical protein